MGSLPVNSFIGTNSAYPGFEIIRAKTRKGLVYLQKYFLGYILGIIGIIY
jgi:hypothetical protein